MTANEQYNHFVDKVRQMKAAEVARILHICDGSLPIIRGHDPYLKMKEDPLLVEIMVGLQRREFKITDSPGKMWFNAIRLITRERDIDVMLMQLALFIAAQELKLHFVEDDTIRLALTYLHLNIIKKLAENEDLIP